MFKKESTFEGGSEDTMIALGVKVDGEFVSHGNIIIEGEVHGSIKTERDLRVGEQAKIVANVVADNAIISGEVQGNMKVAEKLELTPTSRVTGDVEAKIVSVAPGAIFCGHCSMPGNAEAISFEDKKKTSRRGVVAQVDAEELQPTS